MDSDSLPGPASVPPLRDDGQHGQRELARVLYAQRQRTAQARALQAQGKKREHHNAHIKTLSRQIEQLNQQIETLTQSRDLLISQRLHRFDDLDGSSVKVVVEYFRVLERGLLLAPVDAVAFLQKMLADDVQINSFVGRSVAVEQWTNHSMCWRDMHLQLVDTSVFPLTDHEAIVKSEVSFTVTISRLTLAMVFPHILQYQALTKRLLGRTLVGHCRQDFVYDCRKKQVVHMEVAIDFLCAFSKQVRDPATLAMLFERALITDQFVIGEIDQETARRRRQGDRDPGGGNGRTLRASPPEVAEAEPRIAASDKLRLDYIM